MAGMSVLIALVAVLLIGVVLIQNPKGGGVDSTFGGSANQMFGAAKSTDFVEKLTWYLAAGLLILCIITAVMFTGAGTEAGDIIPLKSQ